MGGTLRLLIIEDVEDHALLIVRELQKGGFDPIFERVETVQELEAALEAGPWDAIISDFNLPGFNGIDVLRMVQERGLDLPFLLVSGAIGEEKAAEVMKAGAHDYIRKGNYARLVPTLERELQDTKIRHERRQSAEELTKYREHLEELVQERTAELVKVNEALLAEIEERKRAEVALQESESRYRTLFESIDEGYCIIEMIFDGNDNPIDYRFLTINPSFEKQTGLVNAQGKRMRELAPEHEEYWFEIYGRIALTGEPARFQKRAEQLHRWYDVYAFSLGPPENRQVAILFNDITERKRAEEEITRLNADLAARVSELEDRNQELEAFNRMVSHDLRQPLNIIGLSCQELDMLCSDQNENCKKSIQRVYKGMLRMNTIIETLLTFSRSTHGDLQREVFNISDMAKSVIAEARLTEPNRRVSLKVAEGIMANGDPRFLRAVLENLIGNAWKYTGKREAGFIEFGVTEIDGIRGYFVRDNGKGFDMADAEKLFIPFQRLPDAEEFEGSGIGLATVERIIRRHGGRIWAEGEPDKGATFYFTLDALPSKG